MASYDQRIAAEDDAAVEAYRTKFGDDKAAEFAADLYKARRTAPPAPETPIFGVFPRWTLVLIAVWLALLETAEKLPRLLLAFPGYEATLAELQAKMMQPDITAAQLAKAQNEAKASAYQPDLTAVQLDKNRFETKAASFQPDTAAATLDKTRNEASASIYQPKLAEVQVEKNTYEAQATAYAPAKALAEAKSARWQPSLMAAQGLAAQTQWMSGGPNDAWLHQGNEQIQSQRPPLYEDDLLRASRPIIPAPIIDARSAKGATMEANAKILGAINNSLGIPDQGRAPSNTASVEPPSSSPPELRTPKNFDCRNGKHFGTDWVICDSPKLLDALARLEDAYDAARAAHGDGIVKDEVAWINHYGPACGLPRLGQPSDSLIQGTAFCVGRAIEARINQLQN